MHVCMYPSPSLLSPFFLSRPQQKKTAIISDMTDRQTDRQTDSCTVMTMNKIDVWYGYV